MKWLKEFLQKLGVVKLAKGGEIVGPGNSEDKVGPFILPPGKAVLNSMTVTINGEDFSEYVKDVEVNYVEPPTEYPTTIAEEQHKWEVGQEDTQPLPVIEDGPPLAYGKDYYLDNPDVGHVWRDWEDDEMDCE